MEVNIIPEKKFISGDTFERLSVRLTMHLETKDKVIKKELRKIWSDLDDDSSVEALLELIKRMTPPH